MPMSTWVAYTMNPPRIHHEGGGNRSEFRAYVKRHLGLREFDVCARVTAAREMPEVLAAWDATRGTP